jgi:triacylglycerol lipase
VLAGNLAEMIEDSVGPDQPLNLFGYSMGGLICRHYLQVLGGAVRTRRFVTLATPHHGTWMAYFYPRRPACIQMRPGSPFLCELSRNLVQLERLDMASIWTPFDLSVVPPTSSCLSVGKNMRVLSPFHATLLYDPRVLGAVRDLLL